MSMGKQIYYHQIRENLRHMHPRLKELALQAGAVEDNGTIITTSMDDSVFAQLIVRECIDVGLEQKKWVEDQTVFNESDEVWNRARIQQSQHIVDKIKQHFGVE